MKYLFLLLVAPSLSFAIGFRDHEQMNLEKLKAHAFTQCQLPFEAPRIEPISILDPPKYGGLENEGMVFQEELAVRTTNLLDRDGFYFSPRPRAAVNNLPMEVFVDTDDLGTYQRKTWYDANPDYSSHQIIPTIDKNKIPAAGRVLTEVIIGHRSPSGDYPQLFDLRSSAYVRFAGYPPEITGASLRLAAHRIFSLGAEYEHNVREDFPVIRALFMKIKNPTTAQALAFVESDLFCGALTLDMTEGEQAQIVVDGHWYTRRDFKWQEDRHTGLVAYSSMLWKTEKDTPWTDRDEAHDSDTLHIEYPNGKTYSRILEVPEHGVRFHEFAEPRSWSLANDDRDPSHYADFSSALGHTNYNFRASYKVEILESNIQMGLSLYESRPDGEYGDNLVAVSTIRQNIKKATSPAQSIHFKYKTTAYTSH